MSFHWYRRRIRPQDHGLCILQERCANKPLQFHFFLSFYFPPLLLFLLSSHYVLYFRCFLHPPSFFCVFLTPYCIEVRGKFLQSIYNQDAFSPISLLPLLAYFLAPFTSLFPYLYYGPISLLYWLFFLTYLLTFFHTSFTDLLVLPYFLFLTYFLSPLLAYFPWYCFLDK